MSTLVLVDLENLLLTARDRTNISRPFPSGTPDQESLLEDWWGPAPAEFHAAPLAAQGPVVVLASNNTTLRQMHCAADYVRALAFALCEVLGLGAPRALEPCLTLSIPQAADAALLRLLWHAPSADMVGPFTALAAVTTDRGLCQRLHASLVPAWCCERELTRARFAKNVVTLWTAAGRPLRRAAPLPPSWTEGSPVAAPEPGWGALITTEPHARWASARSVDSAARTLSEVAEALEGCPALLSQLGLTEQSARGVGRLGPLLFDARTSLDTVGPSDGVEILQSPLPSREGLAHLAAAPSVGAGAVRLVDAGCTVRTQLPIAVLQELRGPYYVDEGAPSRLDDTALLERMSPLLGYGPEVRIDLDQPRHATGRLRGTVVPPGGTTIPPSWWLRCNDRGRRTPRGSVEVDIPWLHLAVTKLEGLPARFTPRRDSHGRRSSGFRAALSGPVEAQLCFAAPHSTLTLARSADRQPLAVLATRPLRRDSTVVVQCLQDASPDYLAARLPALTREAFAALALLPLVVPL